MDALIGFGAPGVVALWVGALLVAGVWLVRQQRRSRLLTIPAYVVLLWMVVPILLQYPFAFSPLNVVTATGPKAYESYVPVLDRAFVICLVGMASFAAGLAIKPRRGSFAPLQHVVLGMRAWSSSSLLAITGAGVMVLVVLLLLAGVTSAGGIRDAAMMAPAFRPVFNLASTVLPTLIGLALLVAVERRRAWLIGLLACLLLLAVVTGSRGVAFGGIAAYIATVLTYRSLRGALSTGQVVAMIPVAIVMLFLILFLGDVRAGQYNAALTAARFGRLLFYGNNFSDLRDFAWVLSYWNGKLFWGRTQLAGVLGFIPSVLFPLRRAWAWGPTSLDMTGLVQLGEVTEHPGLRPGIFGEWYFNFGIPGVIFAGLATGYVVRRLHVATSLAVRDESPFAAKLQIYAAYIVVGLLFNFLITAAFFSVYATLITLNAVRVLKYMLRVTGGARRDAPASMSPEAVPSRPS